MGLEKIGVRKSGMTVAEQVAGHPGHTLHQYTTAISRPLNVRSQPKWQLSPLDSIGGM